MENQAQNPAWSDGLANRELLDSLDAIGGAGSDLADQEVFEMLDEIEKLANEKLRASKLLQGTGQANEPKLNPTPSAAKTAMLAEQFKDLPDLIDSPGFFSEKPVDSAGFTAIAQPPKATAPIEPLPTPQRDSVAGEAIFNPDFSPEPSLSDASSDLIAVKAMLSPNDTSPGNTTAKTQSDTTPFNSNFQSPNSLTRSQGKQAAPQADHEASALNMQKPELRESREVAPSERVMELGSKRSVDPEKFLPPDFFDPRDRKPPKKWGRWLALALLIGAMTTLAGYLVMKTYKDSRPAAVRGIGDLTKPASK